MALPLQLSGLRHRERTLIEVGQPPVSGPVGSENAGEIDVVRYDHVLPIAEIDQQGGGVAKISFGYTIGEKPFMASPQFIDDHVLP